MRLREITEGVGRITKQNQTVDVGPDEVTKQAAKFGNKVDRDGRPPTLSKKVKGKSTNVLFNLGLAESTHYANIEEFMLDEGVIDSITDFLEPYVEKARAKLKKLQGAVKQEYMETDLMWEIMKKGDKARPFEIEFANKQFKDVLKGVGLGAWLALPIPGNTLWITLLEKLLNKFDISIMPDEVKRQVFNSMYENFADGKVKGKSRPGRVKRAGASCNGSVTALRKRAKNASGEKAKMYHWCANMKSGKKK